MNPMPAVDVDKLNQLTLATSEIYTEYILTGKYKPEEVDKLYHELKKFSVTPKKSIAFAALGSLFFIKGDFTNMQFQYKMAIRYNPTNELIRYNFASSLYHSYQTKQALEQLIELLRYITTPDVLFNVYKLLERELQLPKCHELLNKMVNSEMAKIPKVSEWLTNKQYLLSAYEHLNIDLTMLHKLFDEINTYLRPTFPMALDVQHYYEEIDNTIYYVFVDSNSSNEQAFEHCMKLLEFVSDFETRNNIDFKNFVMDYERKQQ